MQSLRQRRALREKLQHDFNGQETAKFPFTKCKRANIQHETKTTHDEANNNLNSTDTTPNCVELNHATSCDILSASYLSDARYDDLLNPRSWSVSSRWMYTAIIATTGCLVSFASSNAAPTVPQAMQEYNVSEEVALLACTTYFITFGIGTMVAAPLTEVYGR